MKSFKFKICLLLIVLVAFVGLFSKGCYSIDNETGMLTSILGNQEEGLPNRVKDAVLLFIGNCNAYVNNEQTQIDDNSNVVPVAENGTTFVPVRFVSEALKCEVNWNDSLRNVEITKGDKKIIISLNDNTINVNGTVNHLESAAKVSEGRVLIPLRAAAEALGKKVFYSNGLIIISDKENIYDAKNDKSEIDNIIRKVNTLKKVTTQEEIDKILEESGFKSYSNRYNEMMEEEYLDVVTTNSKAMMKIATAESTGDSESSVAADFSASADMDYSTTNIQVKGVDEADIVKTNGKYIYQISESKVYVVDVQNPENMNTKKVLTFAPQFVPREMYLDDKTLSVVGTSNDNIMRNYSKRIATDMALVRPGRETFTKLYVYDIVQDGELKLNRESKIEGDYVSSRKIEDYVYLICNKNIRRRDELMPIAKEVIVNEEANVSEDLMTDVKIDGINCVTPIMAYNYMNVAAVNVNSKKSMVVNSYLGAGENVYASNDSFYITRGIFKDFGFDTEVIKFSIDKENLTYIGKKTVPGNIINQYSMDEHNGYFRIATITNEFGIREKSNNVYVLDEALSIVGSIREIAPGEQIYSTRFMGDKLYMVTFETMDPLFVIDLSNPKRPEILGKLKIPGYSDYMHPYDDNHILGFGMDTEDTKSGVTTRGMKVALFDVSDVENPKEMYKVIIGGRGTNSELLSNPKALLFSKERELLAFPVNVYEENGRITNFSFNGMYVYKLNLTDGFVLKNKITHISQETLLKTGRYYYNYRNTIKRGIYIGDTLFTISDSGIKSNSLDTGKELDMLKHEEEILENKNKNINVNHFEEIIY